MGNKPHCGDTYVRRSYFGRRGEMTDFTEPELYDDDTLMATKAEVISHNADKLSPVKKQ